MLAKFSFLYIRLKKQHIIFIISILENNYYLKWMTMLQLFIFNDSILFVLKHFITYFPKTIFKNMFNITFLTKL
jgi:hypothetical protein